MKKKIRGLRRKARELDAWRRANLAQIFDEDDSRDYCKMRIHPWFSLSRPRVPHGLKIQMIKALIEIHDAWKKRLDESGEEYYLAIWLFKNYFIESQVVMARREELDYYQETFFPPTETKEFDYHSYKPIQNLLERFTLKHMNTRYFLEDDERINYADDEAWDAQQKRLKAAKQNNLGVLDQDGMKVYIIKGDDVWVARSRLGR